MPEPYASHVADAHKAYEQGRYKEAAAHWRKAREHAESQTDRDEATYREAASLKRAGRTEQSLELFSQLAEKTRGTRTARAAFELAFHEIEHGDPARGHDLLSSAIVRFPDSGIARDAVRRRRAHLVATQGSEAAERELEKLAKTVRGSELESTPLFERAKLLEQRGKLAEARAQYLEIAERFPYPVGAYWNDSVLAAARLSQQLGQAKQAEKLLLEMIERREHSAITGSYERSYDKAYWLLGEFALASGRWRRARDWWLELYDDFSTSLLRDDALWAAATISFKNGDTEAACEHAARLKDELADSRFSGCGRLVCARSPEGDCGDYIERAVERALRGSGAGVP